MPADDFQFVNALSNQADSYSREELISLAAEGRFVGTFTARHGQQDDAIAAPQPALWTRGPLEQQSGHQEFPIIHPGNFPTSHVG